MRYICALFHLNETNRTEPNHFRWIIFDAVKDTNPEGHFFSIRHIYFDLSVKDKDMFKFIYIYIRPAKIRENRDITFETLYFVSIFQPLYNGIIFKFNAFFVVVALDAKRDYHLFCGEKMKQGKSSNNEDRLTFCLKHLKQPKNIKNKFSLISNEPIISFCSSLWVVSWVNRIQHEKRLSSQLKL